MSGSNPEQLWNLIPNGPTPLTGQEQFLAAQTASPTAPIYRYPWTSVMPPPPALPWVSVLTFGADPTGVADSSAAFNTANAVGVDIYIPPGTYRLNSAVTMGLTTQAITWFGDGNASVIQIDTAFDPTEVNGVVRLVGREQFAPTLRDFRIIFIQPTSPANRAAITQYVPAIYFGLSNRFRLRRLRIENAWDGIVQGTSPHSSGGWWMEDIEISCYDTGLSVGSNLDFSHIKGWHHWPFGSSSSQETVITDGNTYAMRIGVGGPSQAINAVDITIYKANMSIDTAGSWTHFANLMLDGGCTLNIINCLWTHIVNLYMTTGQIAAQAGTLNITNFYGYTFTGTSTQPLLSNSGASISIAGATFILAGASVPAIIYQSAGGLRIVNSSFDPSGLEPTLVPSVHVAGGHIQFVGNAINAALPGSVELLQIDVDSVNNVVAGNSSPFGWTFTPPGLLGNYEIYGALRTAITSTPTRTPHNFGFEPTLTAYYSGGIVGVTFMQLGDQGTVHVGGSAPSVFIDSVAFINGGVYCDNSAHTYANPSSGQTIDLLDNHLTHILDPGAPVTTLTVVMPPNPNANQYCRIAVHANPIGTLTLSPNAGQTISNPPTTAAADISFLYAYFGTNWFRMQ